MFDYPAFAALIRRKRSEMKLSQENLAADALGDPMRKGDISKFERGRKKPQEATIQKLCKALAISEAEMTPIRQSRPAAEQLAAIPTLSREELQNLAARFGLENAFDAPDPELRRLLTLKADEHRALKAEVDAIDAGLKRLSNLKAAAQDAIARVDLDEVETLLSRVQEVELEEAAKTAELRAQNALLRGNVEQAYRLLAAAADSFAAVDPLEPARRRMLGKHGFFPLLYLYGRRFGGSALVYSAKLIEEALTSALKDQDPRLWAFGKINLANAWHYLGAQFGGDEGTRYLEDATFGYEQALDVLNSSDEALVSAMALNNLGAILNLRGMFAEGDEGLELLRKGETYFRDALLVRSLESHPYEWAETQYNLGICLRNIAKRHPLPDNLELLSQSIDALRASINLRPRNKFPQEWAESQTCLGASLLEKAISLETLDSLEMLDQAVSAYVSAAEYLNKTEHPVSWGNIQNDLGIAYLYFGKRLTGKQSIEAFSRALATFNDAMEVRTRDTHPVNWAVTQKNIAVTLADRANELGPLEQRVDLEAALEASNRALKVFDRQLLTFENEATTTIRDDILAAIEALK